jgi:hypothetical protein
LPRLHGTEKNKENFLLELLNPWTWDWCVDPKCRLITTNHNCVTSQKSEDLKILFMPFNNVWISQHRFSRNTRLLSSIICRIWTKDSGQYGHKFICIFNWSNCAHLQENNVSSTTFLK